VGAKGGRVKKSTLPLIIIFAFVLLVAFSALRYNYMSNIYRPPEKLPEMYKAEDVEVDEPTVVKIAVHIDKDGKPIADSLVESSGDPRVDADALKQALLFKYEPATLGKRFVDGWVTIPIKYYPRRDTTEEARTN
jgi:TonB family protein